MDIAAALESLGFTDEYQGSVTPNTEAVFDALIWTVTPPTWAAVQVADAQVTLDRSAAAISKRFIDEGVRRIQLQIPSLDTLDEIKLIAAFWNMLGAPNAAQTNARDLYLYVRDTALPAVAAANQVQLDAVVPENDDPLPGQLAAWPVV